MSNTIKNKTLYNISNDPIISYDSEGNPYSYYSSEKWVLWSLKTEINFTRLSGKFKDQAKDIYYKTINNSTLKISTGHIKSLMEGAVMFEKCISSCGGDSYVFLNDDKNFRKVIIEAKSKKLKSSSWKVNLRFISQLYREGIIKRHVGISKDLVKHLSIDGHNEKTIQTLCMPERIANAYYSKALELIENYHPYRKDISDAYYEYIKENKILSPNFSQSQTIRKYARKGKPSLPEDLDTLLDYNGTWLSKLRGACYIVIAAFTGCRDGEIRSLNLSSYQEKKYADMIIPTILGEHTKPNVGGVARKTSWVTIPSVKKAIELMWDSCEFSREYWREKSIGITHSDEKNKFLKNTDKLFVNFPHNGCINPNAGRKAINDSIANFIKSVPYFASKEDIKEFNILNPSRYGDLKIGEKLLPHPHSFRRTFAVYLVKNKLVSLLDLKYQFKHMNIAMTSWYANQANIASHFDMMLDFDLQSEIAMENENYITDIFYYIYNESEKLGGPEGKRISNLRSEGNLEIYLSKDEIREQIKQGRLSIVEHPGGYCTNPSCDRICDMTTCQYKIVTKDQALILSKTREKLISKYTSLTYSKMDIPNIISKIYFEIKSIEKVLSEHELEYKEFNNKGLNYE